MLAAWNQIQPLFAERPAAKALLFMAVTLPLTAGIYQPTHLCQGAKHWNLDPVSALKVLQCL